MIKRGLGGDTVREVRVEKRRADEIEAALWNRDEGEPLYDFDVMCETCGAGDRSETLLLCDGCDLGFHLVNIPRFAFGISSLIFFFFPGVSRPAAFGHPADEVLVLPHLLRGRHRGCRHRRRQQDGE